MGIDLIAHVESRRGDWTYAGEVEIQRRFRHEFQAIAVNANGWPRGPPPDLSWGMRDILADEMVEKRDITWVLLSELEAAADKLAPEVVQGVLPYIRYLSAEAPADDIRLVLWLDT